MQGFWIVVLLTIISQFLVLYINVQVSPYVAIVFSYFPYGLQGGLNSCIWNHYMIYTVPIKHDPKSVYLDIYPACTLYIYDNELFFMFA